MDFNTKLRSVTLRIKYRDEKGSGILLNYPDSESLYILTAKHCLIGTDPEKKFNYKKIKIDKISNSGKTVYKLKKQDQLILDPDQDLGMIVIPKSNFPLAHNMPSIHLGEIDESGNDIWLKGYPRVTGQEEQRTVKARLDANDSDGSSFLAELPTTFLQYYDKSSVRGLCKGFSGSGLCAVVGEDIFLQGVVSKFDASGGFSCIATVDFFRQHIPGIKVHKISSERILPDRLLMERLGVSLSQLSPRYSKVNFELPIEKYFNELGYDKSYRDSVQKIIVNASVAIKDYLAIWTVLDDELRREIEDGHSETTLAQKFQELLKGLLEKAAQVTSIFSTLENDIPNRSVWEPLAIAVKDLDKLIKNYDAELSSIRKDSFEQDHSKVAKILKSRRFTHSSSLDRAYLTDLVNFISRKTVVFKKYMLLKGEAGHGKSQLLGVVAQKRQEEHIPTILILGQSLSSSVDIWRQIRDKICPIDCSTEDFLRSLNEKGKRCGQPALVLIDAINEGKGIKLWNRNFETFINQAQPYPFVKLVLSFRTTYQRSLFHRVDFDKDALLTHTGFEGFEREAVRFFFENENLEVPNLPFYRKQFANPLFLKLFMPVYKRNMASMNMNTWLGIYSVFENYFEYINDELGRPNRCDYSADKINLVELSIKRFIKTVLKKKVDYLKYGKAYQLIERRVSVFLKGKKGYLDELIHENIFYENMYALDDSRRDELGIDIAFQKMNDHLKINFLLSKIKLQSILAAKNKDTFNYIFERSEFGFVNEGLIEALSIQLPELFNREIFDLWPDLIDEYEIQRSFVIGLRDRASHTFGDATRSYLRKILKTTHSSIEFWSEILINSFQPGNGLDVEFLHHFLMGMELAERDANWTEYLVNYSDEPYSSNGPNLILRWVNGANGALDLQGNGLRRVGTVLFWFLGSNNRLLRDITTKTAIRILMHHADILLDLMNKFSGVNDPYILQRIYAIAFGVVIRNRDLKEVGEIASYVYTTIFDQQTVIADILLRDYARLTIEYAVYLGFKIPSPDKIRPPYKSEDFGAFPANTEIEGYPENLGYDKDEYAGIHKILDSMVTERSSRNNHMYGDFGRYTFGYAFGHFQQLSDEELSNLAIKLIIEELGYDRVLSDLDNNLPSGSRHGKTIERFGKKYQWIAFHRLLATASDHYLLSQSAHDNTPPEPFSGAWIPNVRDIDPTRLLAQPKTIDFDFWWSRYEYHVPKRDLAEWLIDETDLPDPLAMIEVTDESGEKWLTLECNYNWKPSFGNQDSREIWYQLRSYLVSEKQDDKMFKWMGKQNLMGRWMPEGGYFTEMYLREYYWSPAFKDFSKSYYDKQIWHTVHDPASHKKIGEVSPTTLEYLWEEELDKSQEDTTGLSVPSKLLFDMLGLSHGEKDATFIGSDGEIIAFDPSLENVSERRLLVKKDHLIKCLAENDLKIIWTVLGEKLSTERYDPDKPENSKRMEISYCITIVDGKLKHSKTIRYR